MGVLLTNQWFDYPMYLAEVVLDNGTVVAFWVSSFSGFAANSEQTEPVYDGAAPTAVNVNGPDTGLGAYDSSCTASLLSVVKSWAEDFDWGALISGASYSSIAITEYKETSADATP